MREPGVGDPGWHRAEAAIIAAGRRMDQRGWVPATGGNISARMDDGRIAITRSGAHKGALEAADVIEIGPDGAALASSGRIAGRPSAETLLHTQLYAAGPTTNAVLHGHSIAATVLSMTQPDPVLQFTGYELLKLFEDQSTHHTTLDLPVFDNDQDIARLCSVISPFLASMRMGYLIRGHGVYVWGPTMEVALARLEGLEFLLCCMLEARKLHR